VYIIDQKRRGGKMGNENLAVVENALIRQLSETNERSRMYSRQFWQLPVAYFGVVALALSSLAKSSSLSPIVGGVLAGMGICVLCMMIGVRQGVARAVKAIQDTEEELGLQGTVTKVFFLIDTPNFALVLLGIAASIVVTA
jgi:hypothetical protein